MNLSPVLPNGKIVLPAFFSCLYLSFPGCLRLKLRSHMVGWGQGFSDNLGLFLNPLSIDAFVKFSNTMNF